MPVRRKISGAKLNVDAWVEDGRCEIDEFLTVLKAHSPLDWCKLVSLIAKVAKDGVPENDEICRLVANAPPANVYQFVTPSSFSFYWFLYGTNVVLCSSHSPTEGDVALRSAYRKALRRRKQYLKERNYGSAK